jgi:hypothetical protein
VSSDALEILSDGVRCFFELPWVITYAQQNYVTLPSVGITGWKTREQQLNALGSGSNRVIFIPGRVDSPDQGTFVEPRRSSTNPRPLATWLRPVTASIWSCDVEHRSDERKQIEASTKMLALVWKAIVYTIQADAILEKASKDPKNVNQSFGIELLLEFIHRQPVLDFTNPVVGPPVGIALSKSPSS